MLALSGTVAKTPFLHLRSIIASLISSTGSSLPSSFARNQRVFLIYGPSPNQSFSLLMNEKAIGDRKQDTSKLEIHDQ